MRLVETSKKMFYTDQVVIVGMTVTHFLNHINIPLKSYLARSHNHEFIDLVIFHEYFAHFTVK